MPHHSLLKCRDLFFLFVLLSQAAFAKTAVISVCNSWDINSLKKAISIATAGDTILVQKGEYKEYNIVIDKPLTIKGIDYPLIDGQDKGEIIRIAADHVTLDGLYIVNVGTSYTSDHAAIRVVRSAHFLIQNVHPDFRLEFLSVSVLIHYDSKQFVIPDRYPWKLS